MGGCAADGRILSHPKSATQFHFGTVRIIQGGYGTLLMAACWPLSKAPSRVIDMGVFRLSMTMEAQPGSKWRHTKLRHLHDGEEEKSFSEIVQDVEAEEVIWLPPRDSNPDMLIQSQLSCR